MNRVLDRSPEEKIASQISILFIEDNPGDIRLFQEMLKEATGDACRIIHKDRLSSALVWLAENPIDVILLDLGLPESQGIDTLLHLQKAYPHVPAIVLTGLRDNELATHALRQGAQDYLMKEQVTGDMLFHSICYAIERKRAEAEIKLNEARMESLLKIAHYDASASAQELLDFALREALTLTGSEIGYIYFYDNIRKEFTLNTWSKGVMEQCQIAEPLTLYELDKTGLWGEAVRQAKPIVVNDFQAPHPLKKGYPEGHAPLFRYLTVPVYSADGIVAVVGVANKRFAYDESDVRQLTLLTDSAWNIARQKLTEATLRKSEEKYRSIVENAAEGIYQATADRFITVNPAFADMLGYQSSEEMVETITDISRQVFVDPEQRLKLGRILEEQGSIKGFETEFRRKDGRRIWVSINSQAATDDKGRLLYDQGLCRDVTERNALDEERRQNLERLRKALGATVQAIAALVETRDPYTAGHQHQVADLARAIATEMGLAPDQINGLRMASSIHDIGKICVPAEILSTPRKLTDVEFNLIAVHPQAAHDILQDIDFPWPIARMVLEHHERMNGSGYPQGLSGDQILLESRIIAVADVVDAIASHRPYRPAHAIDVALDEISNNRGTLYDAPVVDACLKIFREGGYRLVGSNQPLS